MARVSPQEAAEKWAANTSAATQYYTRGVQRVQTAPGAKAAANKDGYRQGVNDNVDKWSRNVGAVTLTDWQQMTTSKGAANLSTGVNAAKPKMAAKMQMVLAAVDSAVAKVDSMPNRNYADRKARMNAFSDAMHASAQSGR